MGTKKKILLIVIISVIITLAVGAIILSYKEYSPVVEISSGKLQGLKSVSRDGREFFSFLKIPFAKPPIKELRYEPPEPFEKKWEGIYDASSYGPPCIQMNLAMAIVEGHENCLHLNIHVPKIPDEESTELLPVIVFIHGGVFVFGTGVMYGGDYFMDEGNVVFITINYRLGSFGFLNTGDGVIRGNMGLKDQNMALRWIQQNIKAFGGDKNRVTLMGESAGAASAEFHTLTNMSKGLFHKAIAQSGSALSPWTLYDKPKEQAYRFAEVLNCTSKSSNQAVDVNCLKNLPVEEIMKVHEECISPIHKIISLFVPTIEMDIPDGKTFLSQHPRTILESGNYSKVPFIAGVNSQEGLAWTAKFVLNQTATEMAASSVQKYFPRTIYLPDDVDSAILQKIDDFYSLEGKPFVVSENFSDFENLTNLFSDRLFKIEVQNIAEMMVASSTQSSPVFLYYFTYESEFTVIDFVKGIKGDFDPRIEVVYSLFKKWFGETFLGKKPEKYGVCHADELFMQLPINPPIRLPFHVPLLPFVQKGYVDYEFSKEFVKLWVDFAKSPNEVKQLTFMGQSWPSQVPGKSLEFLQINNEPKVISSPFQNGVDFWNSLGI